MEGEGSWGENDDEDGDDAADAEEKKEEKGPRHGKWESGKGRCPVTGRRVLNGTEGLRRVLI